MGRVPQDRLSAERSADDSLLLAIAQGDQQAFRQLMQRHAKPMLALAQRVTGNGDDADEIVQEAFLKVWRLAARWEVEGTASFATWFHRVVLNACLDRRRRPPMARLEDSEDPIDPMPIGSETAEDKQRGKAVLAALAELPARQKQAMELFYFAEVSGPQAAQILEMSQSALEALLVRGRRGLKKALERRGILSIGDIL